MPQPSPDTTTVFVTRLQLRSLRYLPAFVRASVAIAAQAAESKGFLGGHLGFEMPRAFWTVTMWEGPVAMRAFRNVGAHGPVMRHTATWARAASNVGWEHRGRALPTWEDAHQRLVTDGRPMGVETVVSDVRHHPFTLRDIPVAPS